jgi:hypothetical protein
VYRQEVRAKVPAGEGVTQSNTSVYLVGDRGEFEETERIELLEREYEDAVEVEETVHEVDANGRWNAREKRTKTVILDNGEPEREEEQIYREDSRGRLTLSERVVSTQDLIAGGDQRWTVETHSNKVGGPRRTRGGKLELSRRVTIISSTLPGNLEQTIEEVEQRSPGNPQAGLRIVERTITTSRPLGNGEKELEVEVQKRDGSGRFKTIMTKKTTISN